MSLTVTVCSQDALPELFVAVQVTVVVPARNGSLMSLSSLRVAVTVTFSPVVVGVPRATVAWHELSAVAVLLAGQLIVGAPGSGAAVIVTLKVHVSPVEAVAVTVVVPTGKKLSLA